MAAAFAIPVLSACATSLSSSGPANSVPMASITTQLCRFRLSALISPLQHHRAPTSKFAGRYISQPSASLEQDLKQRISSNPVVVYSKSWCPYCLRVKDLFNDLGVKPSVVELDELENETEVQSVLQRMTGQSTVPNVFIGGKHIGGCDDTYALYNNGKLIPLLKESGLSVS